MVKFSFFLVAVHPYPKRECHVIFIFTIAIFQGGAEFDALRRQMEELQSIVRLSFDLQLDMQRAIRQEVSAALSVRSAQASGKRKLQSYI